MGQYPFIVNTSNIGRVVSTFLNSTPIPNSFPGAVLRIADWQEPGTVELRKLAYEELCMRYETDFVGENPDPAKLCVQVAISIVTESINIDVACAALVIATGEYEEFTGPVLEIKRVFVHPDYRGVGLSRHLMNRISEEARAYARINNFSDLRLILETGTKQPEAMSLYTTLGYVPIKTYGEWQNDPLSRCYELPLAHEMAS